MGGLLGVDGGVLGDHDSEGLVDALGRVAGLEGLSRQTGAAGSGKSGGARGMR